MEDNTAHCAKYWWHNGIQNGNQKTSKTWNTVRCSVSNKQKCSTISSRKSNSCVWASAVQLTVKISETSKLLKVKNSNLSSTNFYSSFLISPKCPTMSPQPEATAYPRPANSSKSPRIYQWWSPRLGHGAGLAALKPLQVSK